MSRFGALGSPDNVVRRASWPMASDSDHRPAVLAVARWPVGGIRTYLRDLFAAPALQGYAFVLVAPNEEGLDEYVAGGRLACREWIATGPSIVEMTRAVSAASRHYKPTLVHSHGFLSGVISGLARQLTGFPHLLTVHDLLLDTQFKGLGGWVRHLGLGISLGSPDYIHCVTGDSRDNLLARYPWLTGLRRKTVVIPHGVDTGKIALAPRRELATELGWSPDTVIFGFLGRFMAQKGFRVLMDAMEILKNRGLTPARARVLAVGSGGYLREDRARIAALGLEGFFAFWPYQTDVASILKGIHCLVMPSLWEASGLLAMEAMVAGTPVIGTDCVGLRETLAASPSVRVRANDAVQLSEAIASFVERPDTQAAIQFQREAIQRFSADRSFAALHDLYDRVR
jgi:glycosyltransferase involved in cell wall biosynthesis